METGLKVVRRFRSWKGRTSRVMILPVLTCLFLLSSCKGLSDAAAAADQLKGTAHELSLYYKDLAGQVDNTVALNQIQQAVFGVPFEQSDRDKLLEIRNEIDKRAAMARTLSKLAAAYASLAGSTISTDAGTAASELGDKLVDCKALPDGSPVPDILGQAVKLLIEYAQTRDLKRGAKAIQETVSGVDRLFEGEKPYYVSLARTRLVLAATLANKLVDSDQVDLQPVIAPALKPFGLEPKLNSAASTEYKGLAKDEIQQRQKDQTAAAVDSADDISASLKRTDQTFTALVAAKK